MINWIELSAKYLESNSLQAARELELYSTQKLIDYFKHVPGVYAAECLKHMSRILVTEIIEQLPSEKSAEILGCLPIENILVILRPVSDKKLIEITTKLPDALSQNLQKKIIFPENSAGYMMNPDILNIHEDFTVKQAIEMVKAYSKHIDYYIFITDRNNLLKGYIYTRQLLMGEPDSSIEKLTYQFPFSLNPYSPYRLVKKSLGWLEYHALPVVEKGGLLLGAISFSSLRQMEHKMLLTEKKVTYEMESQAILEILKVASLGVVSNLFSKEVK